MSGSLRDGIECRAWIHRHGIHLKTLNKLPTDVDTVGAGQMLHPDHTTSRFSMELLLPSEVVCFLFIQQTTAFVPAKNPERLVFKWRSTVRKNWPIGRRSHPGKDRSPSCEQTLQDAATARRLSPHPLFGAQFTTITGASLLHQVFWACFVSVSHPHLICEGSNMISTIYTQPGDASQSSD